MAAAGALTNIDPDDLMARISNGEVPSRIATELGVTKAAVYYHLADRPDWVKARKIGMAIRLDSAQEVIETAQDALTLGRGREAFRAQAWRAEREHPDAWGATSKVTGGDGGPIQVQIVRFAAQQNPVIDVTPERLDK